MDDIISGGDKNAIERSNGNKVEWGRGRGGAGEGTFCKGPEAGMSL